MAVIRLTDGQRILAPQSKTRPTSIRARKALFDMLVHRLRVDFTNCAVLDIFAGAGTFGFEALSRGSPQAIFIDRAPRACAQIANSAHLLGFDDRCFILSRHALRLGKRPSFLPRSGLVFADPPYCSALSAPAVKLLARGGWLQRDALVIVELAANQAEPLFEHVKRIAEHRAAAARFIILSAAVK